eukprot:9232894-Alexandrium_andersonii.AAC.1
MQDARARTHRARARSSPERRALRANSSRLRRGLASLPEPIPQAGHREWCLCNREHSRLAA